MSGILKTRVPAFTDGSNTADTLQRGGASTELHIRLWNHPTAQEGVQGLPWKIDSIPTLMISDLVAACNGVLRPETQDRLTAKFEGPHQAITAAKRIQWALLGYFQDQPMHPVAAAIVVNAAATPTDFENPAASGRTSFLELAKPAQILVAETVYEKLKGVPGLEFRSFGPEPGVRELVWAPPETYRVWEQTLNQRSPSPVPAEENLSATRVLQTPLHPTFSAPDPTSQPGGGWAGDLTRVDVPPTNVRLEAATENGETGAGEASLSNRNPLSTGSRSGRVRALFAAGGIAAILAVAIIWISVQRNADAGQTAKLRVPTASVTQEAAPVSAPSPKSVTPSPSDPPPVAAPPVNNSVAPAEARDEADPRHKVKEDDSPRGRKARERHDRQKRKTAKSSSSNSDDDEEDEKVEKNEADEKEAKPVASCRLLANEITAYLAIGDKNRAAGRYDDAAREYNAVIQCDHQNARAKEGLVKINQARAVSSRTDGSQGSR